MSFRFAARQRGAIGLVAAATMGLAVLFGLLVVDSGRLYLEQRKLQRVVDMAALEAAGQSATCNGSGASALSVAQGAARRNGFDPAQERSFQVSCGNVSTGAASARSFSQNNAIAEAIRVVAQRDVPASFAGGIVNLFTAGSPTSSVLQASAVATPPPPPLAALTLRSNLVNIDSSRSALLNGIFSKMLGGQLNVTAAGYQGLLDTQINLLDFLKDAAIHVTASAGDIDKLLKVDAQVTKLVDAMITAATKAGATAEVLSSLLKLKVAGANTVPIKLGEILNLHTGTPEAGLNSKVQLFQVVQAMIELAAKTSAAAIDLTSLGIPGLLNVTLKLLVIEAPQFSGIGNPALAKLDPSGPNQIFVRTAQVRAMLSLNLPVLNLVNGLLDATNGLVSGLVGVLSGVLKLNLVATLESTLCLLGAGCEQLDPKILPGAPRIDINVEVASANSRVVDYSCSPNKTLTAQTKTAAVTIRVGQINQASAFDPKTVPAVLPLPVIDIGIKTCHKVLGLLGTCEARRAFAGGGLGVKIDTSVLPNDQNPGLAVGQNLLFQPPGSVLKNIGQPAVWLSTTNGAIVGGLRGTLSGVQVEAFKPGSSNLLGDLIVITGNALKAVNDTLGVVIKNLLSPLLDPLLDNVLALLEVQLNQVDVGANLQCGGRPSLVL